MAIRVPPSFLLLFVILVLAAAVKMDLPSLSLDTSTAATTIISLRSLSSELGLSQRSSSLIKIQQLSGFEIELSPRDSLSAFGLEFGIKHQPLFDLRGGGNVATHHIYKNIGAHDEGENINEGFGRNENSVDEYNVHDGSNDGEMINEQEEADLIMPGHEESSSMSQEILLREEADFDSDNYGEDTQGFLLREESSFDYDDVIEESYDNVNTDVDIDTRSDFDGEKHEQMKSCQVIEEDHVGSDGDALENGDFDISEDEDVYTTEDVEGDNDNPRFWGRRIFSAWKNGRNPINISEEQNDFFYTDEGDDTEKEGVLALEGDDFHPYDADQITEDNDEQSFGNILDASQDEVFYTAEDGDDGEQKSSVWKLWKNRELNDEEVLEFDLVKDQTIQDAEADKYGDEQDESIELSREELKNKPIDASSRKFGAAMNAIRNAKGHTQIASPWCQIRRMSKIRGRNTKRSSNGFVSIKKIPSTFSFPLGLVAIPKAFIAEWTRVDGDTFSNFFSNLSSNPATTVVIGAMIITALITLRNLLITRDENLCYWVHRSATRVGGNIRSFMQSLFRAGSMHRLEGDSSYEANDGMGHSHHTKARWWSLIRKRQATHKQPSTRQLCDDISMLRQNLRVSELESSRLQSESDLAMRKIDEYRNRIASLGSRNTFLQAQNRNSDRILQKALQVERQRSNEEIERVKGVMQVVLERERRLMRSQFLLLKPARETMHRQMPRQELEE